MSKSRHMCWYVLSNHSTVLKSVLAPNNCTCQIGYNGSVCQYGMIFEKIQIISSYIFLAICQQGCSNGGACIAPNQCNCTSSWSGLLCNFPRCNPICENGGEV